MGGWESNPQPKILVLSHVPMTSQPRQMLAQKPQINNKLIPSSKPASLRNIDWQSWWSSGVQPELYILATSGTTPGWDKRNYRKKNRPPIKFALNGLDSQGVR